MNYINNALTLSIDNDSQFMKAFIRLKGLGPLHRLSFTSQEDLKSKQTHQSDKDDGIKDQQEDTFNEETSEFIWKDLSSLYIQSAQNILIRKISRLKSKQSGPQPEPSDLKFGFNLIINDEEQGNRTIVSILNDHAIFRRIENTKMKKYLILCINVTRQKAIVREIKKWNESRGTRIPEVRIYKAPKQQKDDIMILQAIRDQINNNDVFVLILENAYVQYLHNYLKLKDFDFLICDQVNSITPFVNNPFNLLLLKLKIMQQTAPAQPLPIVIGLLKLSLVNDFSPDTRTASYQLIKSFSKSFNCALITLSEQEIQELQMKSLYHILRHQSSLMSSKSHSSHYSCHHESLLLLEKLSKQRETLRELRFFEKQTSNYGNLVQNEAFLIKNNNSIVLFQDAERIIRKLIEEIKKMKSEEDSQNQGAPKFTMVKKLDISFKQHVDNKIRYYSSRLKLDPDLKEAIESILQPQENQDLREKLHYLTQDIDDDKISSISVRDGSCKSWIFTQKLVSDNYTMLEIVKILIKIGLLQDDMTPNIQRKQLIAQLPIKEGENKAQIDEEKKEVRESISTQYSSQLSRQETDRNLIEEIPQMTGFNFDLIQELSYNSEKQYLFNVFEFGREPQQEFSRNLNCDKILLFFENFVKPILFVSNVTERLLKDEEHIIWKNRRWSSIDEFEHSYSQYFEEMPHQKKERMINSNKILCDSLSRLASKVLYKSDEENQREEKEFFHKFQKIITDLDIKDTIQLPTMVKKAYNRVIFDKLDEEMKDGSIQGESKDEECKWVTNFILIMACHALSQNKTQTPNYDISKQEMERLGLVGDSAINLCIALDLVLSGRQSLNEEDLTKEKNFILDPENLSKCLDAFQLQNMLLVIEETPSTEMSIKTKKEQAKTMNSGVQQLQRIVGFMSICFGIETAYLFLKMINVLKIEQNEIKEAKCIKLDSKIIVEAQLRADQKYFLLREDKQLPSILQNLSSSLQKLSFYISKYREISSCDKKSSFEKIKNVLLKQADYEQQASQSQQFGGNFKQRFDQLKLMIQNAALINAPISSEQGGTLPQSYLIQHDHIFIQALTHKSFAQKVLNSSLKDELTKDEQLILNQFHYQLLEYLGDTILNYSLVNRLYFDTMCYSPDFQFEYASSKKMHEVKAWFSSNNFIAFVIYEQFYRTFDIKFRKEIGNHMRKNPQVKCQVQFPLLYDEQHIEHHKHVSGFNKLLFQFCAKKFENKTDDELKIKKSFSIHGYNQTTIQQDNQEINFSALKKNLVKYFSDVFESLVAGIFFESLSFDLAQNITFRLLNSNFIQFLPSQEHFTTRVMNIWSQKWYAKSQKIYHLKQVKIFQLNRQIVKLKTRSCTSSFISKTWKS